VPLSKLNSSFLSRTIFISATHSSIAGLNSKLKSEQNTYILSWTTTPWTLPGNVALAVGNDIDYVKVKVENEVYILAKPLLENVLGEGAQVIETVQGKDLVGMEYEPLFEGAVDGGEKKAWYVTDADFVTIEDGTVLFTRL